ncbi:formyltransferase family protein [Francisella hispaniensis]|uniref:Uncharacterized protein n=1 Tax=Francisella hispaniensis TaxID=622488 RepID=F4BH41_9GAMM|nr:formyltransferase family protein [Francisella hispaniensis]AEE26785.1 hypothetical protein FN3523_1482 [Francisella hispaniensis]
MKICIAGKNNIAIEILEFIIKNKYFDKKDILAVCNKTDDGNDNWQRSFKKYCHQNQVRLVFLEEIYEIENLLFLSLEFDKIIVPENFKTGKLFNIHFSLLPSYKGMYTSIMPILYNEEYTGVTLHEIDRGIDTGNIIAQTKIKIDFNDTARDLYHKYIKYGIQLVKDNFEDIVCERYKSKPQSFESSSYFSKKSIDFSNIIIDLRQTALNIHNQIRAFNFREYQTPSILGYKIISTKILPEKSIEKPGKILEENSLYIRTATIDYDILMYKDIRDDFMDACIKNDISFINKSINVPNILNIQNEKGWTPLIVATYNANTEIMKLLIEKGADTDCTNFRGTTLLMYAKDAYVNTGNHKPLNMILSLKKDIYKKDYYNKDIFDYCMVAGQLEVIDIIKGYYEDD